MTDLIAAFLADRHDEAEASARKLLRTAQDVRLALQDPRLLGRIIPGWHSWPDVEAMCASRLVDIAAKRAILALHRLTVAKRETYRYDSGTGERIPDAYDGDCGICGWFAPEDGGCLTVRHLAGEFAGHPDCKPGWVPSDAT